MTMDITKKINAYLNITTYYRNLAHGMTYAQLWNLIEYLLARLLFLLSDEALKEELHRALESEKE